MAKSNDSFEKGTATVEMAVMMPVYVMLIIVMIYFGGRQVMNIRVMKEVSFLSQKDGEQDASDLPDGFLNLPQGVMGWLDKSVTITDQEIPSDIDEVYLKEVMVENMYNVVGQYVMQGDQLVYTTSMSVTGFGHYVQKYGLIDTVDELATELDKGIKRTETLIEVQMEAPFSLDDDHVADDPMAANKYMSREETTEFKITHSHSHVLVNEEHADHGAFIPYADSAAAVLLPDTEFPRLPAPTMDWQNYWTPNITDP